MSGGIVQLVATGAQDTWLTGRPEVSFFRSNYKRYTHYAATVERQIIQGQPTPGSISMVRFEKKGDLLSYVYLTARDQNGAQVQNLDWSKVIDRVELLIGGQVIDLQDFNYMTDIEPCTGAQTFNQRYMNNETVTPTGPTNKVNNFFPLKFFFCKDWSVSLPLVALQYHDVELRITWASGLSSQVNFGTPSATNMGNPYASANVAASVVTGNGAGFVASSNTANLVLTSNTFVGPLSSGLITGNVAATADILSANGLSVVQSLSNVSSVGTSNAVISFSNTASANVTSEYQANTNLGFWLPNSSALVIPPATAIAAGSTSNTLSYVNQLRSSGITVGNIVVGLPLPNPVYVTSVTPTTFTVAFPATTTATTILPQTLVSFVSSTSSSSLTYGGLTYQIWTNFVYLDQAEREFFAQNTHDLLMTQVQRVPVSSQAIQELALAHPVKFLAFQSQQYGSVYQTGLGSANAANYFLKVQINGVDVGESRPLPAFTDANQYYHTQYGYLGSRAETPILVIPYCLDTSKLQPTGTLNFSRLDTYRLVVPTQLTGGLAALANPAVSYPYLYAVNYNVLRIQKGMGSVLYSS